MTPGEGGGKPGETWHGPFEPCRPVQGYWYGRLQDEDSLIDRQGAQEEPKEGQEDQGEVKDLGGTPPTVLRSPGPPGLRFALLRALRNSVKESS